MIKIKKYRKTEPEFPRILSTVFTLTYTKAHQSLVVAEKKLDQSGQRRGNSAQANVTCFETKKKTTEETAATARDRCCSHCCSSRMERSRPRRVT
jgi:hypothetical protein